MLQHKEIAKQLYEAEKTCVQIQAPLTVTYPDMTLGDAYQIQLETADMRREEGKKLIGMKIGLTSRAMQELLGVDEPDYGHLFDDMLYLEEEPCSLKTLCQPRIEGELTFCLNKSLKGPGVTEEDVLAATEYVVPSIEIVDSRIKDWKIKLLDTVADNGSSAGIVLGKNKVPVHLVDMKECEMVLEKNGAFVNAGKTVEVYGSPAKAVAWLVNTLSEYGIELPAGSLVMSGALTAAQFAEPGDVFTARFAGIGDVTVTFTQ